MLNDWRNIQSALSWTPQCNLMPKTKRVPRVSFFSTYHLWPTAVSPDLNRSTIQTVADKNNQFFRNTMKQNTLIRLLIIILQAIAIAQQCEYDELVPLWYYKLCRDYFIDLNMFIFDFRSMGLGAGNSSSAYIIVIRNKQKLKLRAIL